VHSRGFIHTRGAGWWQLSGRVGTIGFMFEELAQGDDLSHVDDATLVAAITGWTRAEATVASHRLAAIAELTDRRNASDQAVERQYWACDGWDSAAAEVAAAAAVSARAASTLMHQGLALRHRLPQVAKLVAEGTLAPRLAHTIGWRTQLIEDPKVLARVDAELAAIAASFGPLSATKLDNAIDAVITEHDPAAVRRFRNAAKGCGVSFGDRDDATGTTSMWGRLAVTDAELVQRAVEQLARGVCAHDPRTVGERRSQALGVLAVGGTTLPCTCGRPDCTSVGRDARADAIVIHILTDQTPDADRSADPDLEPDPDSSADPEPLADPEPSVDLDPAPEAEPDSEADPDADPGPEPRPTDTGPPAPEPGDHQTRPESLSRTAGLAVIAGGRIVPAPLLTELVRLGASLLPVANAAELCAEPRYRPSAKLARFVRSRDLTCCFPGCDRPAERCDIDHSTPHGYGGLTHPGNTKCLCRKHHLLKTFWTGPTGWTDRQLGDGTMVWISPTGHRYTRLPGSRLLFPRWDTTTPLPAGATIAPTPTGAPDRGLTMPTRTKTRAHFRTQRLHAERRRNQRAIDEDQPPF